MRDLIDILIRLFGRRIILALVLLGVLIGMSIWTIAHLTAEDGTRVSVLWGMVEYTKGKSQSKQVQEFSWPHSPNGKYEAVEVQSENGWQYQVMEVKTQRTILITHGKYDTPNNVSAGRFSLDSTRIAAAYHYTGSGDHNGDYTWVGIWNLETGDRVDEHTIDGWTTNITSVLH